MTYTIPELDTISRQLMSLDRPKKAKMLVVDDEPDNLDLLYRTFRRDFQVLKAESGVHALELLASEGEVAVIISDQRMPEMKGTEFLSRTVPQFPDTMRIILTGFTDVEDLVEAINSGQVYKYITKPWNPDELKAVVQRAAETYELLKQRTEELQRSQSQTALLYNIV
ncbi:MAG: response regulator, partial [Leptolyngbyaceae cyanobacterium bins.302]|nr:response regulator [Leptolyngbyaceae cyanobacterium bins.302]